VVDVSRGGVVCTAARKMLALGVDPAEEIDVRRDGKPVFTRCLLPFMERSISIGWMATAQMGWMAPAPICVAIRHSAVVINCSGEEPPNASYNSRP
jgi:hypothetical protein